MATVEHGPSDYTIEQFIGRLLQVGVLLAASVVLTGGVLYLMKYGRETPDRHAFHGEPADLTSVAGIFQDAFHGSSRAIIQLGVVLLIATPIARVALTVFAFLWQRDYTYTVVTLIVLAILLYSLVGRG